MPFANQILGGQNKLIRPAIQSPNFVHGSAGWSVNKDGSAEFNSATIRGTVTAGTFEGSEFIINSDGAFFYSAAPAAGNLIGSIASGFGTDRFGNAYVAGVAEYTAGAGVTWVALNGSDVIFGDSAGGYANIYGSRSGPAAIGVSLPLVTQSPSSAFESWHAVSISGGPSGSSGTARVKLSPVATFAIFDIEIAFPALGAQGNFAIGSLPSAAYYPLANRHYAPGLAGTATGTPQPRLLIPTSGGVQLVDVPAGASGFGCTVCYPLD